MATQHVNPTAASRWLQAVATCFLAWSLATRSLQEITVVLLLVGVCSANMARAEMSVEELAKLAQSPVGNLISLPFQNNTNLNYGPLKKTQNILNIQPVDQDRSRRTG